MNENARHGERVGDQAGVLAGRAAEAAQRVAGDVVAALHRDVLDRVRHVADRDLDEPFCDLFGGAVITNLLYQNRELLLYDRLIKLLAAVSPENLRKIFRLDLAGHQVGVGDGERAASPVAGRARVRARRIRADTIAGPVEMQDRAAAGGDAVDAHHRRAHAHAGDAGLEFALELAGVMRYVGGRAAHVESDDAVEARGEGGPHRADDAARRPRQDRILALEAARVGEAAVRLYEQQPHAFELGGHLLDVAPEDRRQVGVDHRGIAAADQLHQRADAMRRRDLREPGLPGQPG